MKTKPQVQPIPDEKDLPKGELAVRLKAQPQTSEPTGTIENVPSPYKPNQPNSPQFDPTKMIPPIIGASTATISKITADKVNEGSLSDYEGIQRIETFRNQNGLPKFDANNGQTGTAAFVKIGDKEFYGLNTSMERDYIGIDSLSLRKEVFERAQKLGKLEGKSFSPDGQALTHAEAHTLMLAEKELGKLPEKITLYVDRRTCNQCLGKNGLPLLAELLGIKELIVIDSSGRKILVKPNQPTTIIK